MTQKLILQSTLIKNRFIDKFGRDRYIEFVLSLYESFPLKNRLFFWQEKLLNELSNDLNIQKITFDETYMIFNYCPVHDSELKKDVVPVLNGNEFSSTVSLYDEKSKFPLANMYVLRDLDRFKYPDQIEILYCSDCRQKRSENVHE